MAEDLLITKGTKEEQDPGTTLADIRNEYPGAHLVERNTTAKVHRADTYVLVNGIEYNLEGLSGTSHYFQLKFNMAQNCLLFLQISN